MSPHAPPGSAGQECGFSETVWVTALTHTPRREGPLCPGTDTPSTAAVIRAEQQPFRRTHTLRKHAEMIPNLRGVLMRSRLSTPRPLHPEHLLLARLHLSFKPHWRSEDLSLSSWPTPLAHTRHVLVTILVQGLRAEQLLSGAHVPLSAHGRDRVQEFRLMIAHQMMTFKGLLLQEFPEIFDLIFLSFYWVSSMITSFFQLCGGR